MRTFTDADVYGAVDLGRLVLDVDAALADLGAGRAHQAAKQILPTATGEGMFLTMGAMVPTLGIAVTKLASYVPAADDRPSVSHSTIHAAHASTGKPIAVVRGMAATTMRTAAAAAAVVRRVRPDARIVALVGYGQVNRAVARALAATLPQLREVLVVTRSGVIAAEPHVRARAVSLGEALAHCDIAVSATGSHERLAAVADLPDGAVAITLDGEVTWDRADAPTLSDHDAVPIPSLARAFAQPELFHAVQLIDLNGSAVTDAALVRHLMEATS